MNLLQLPLHPLLVHAAVVFIPLAALAAIGFALRPDWRWVLRWPTAMLNALAIPTLFITRMTGDQLAHATTDNHDLIEKHDQMAGLLTIVGLPMMALALYATWAFASTSPLPSGRGSRTARHPSLAALVRWVLVLLGLATLVATVLTGHSGATAVWKG